MDSGGMKNFWKCAILVVDESRVARSILAAMLAKIGHDAVLEAHDGLTALKLLSQQKVATVFLTAALPDMSGMAFLKAVRSSHPEIQVILIADRKDKASVISAVQNGLSGYLFKPVAPERLARKLRQVHKLS